MGRLIRRAGVDDARAIVPLMNEFNVAEGISWDAKVAGPAIDRLLASDEVGILLVAEEAGALIGYVIVTWGFDLEFAGRDAFLTDLFVASGHREGGIGFALMEAAMQAASAGGAGAITLLVRPENAPALAVYRRAGFEPVPRVALKRDLR